MGIFGPRNSPWENGKFRLTIKFNSNFPNSPPVKIMFCPPISHPNVYSDGEVCISFMNSDKWQSHLGVKEMLVAIQHLLANPNIADPTNRSLANLYQDNRAEYNRRCRVIASNNP